MKEIDDLIQMQKELLLKESFKAGSIYQDDFEASLKVVKDLRGILKDLLELKTIRLDIENLQRVAAATKSVSEFNNSMIQAALLTDGDYDLDFGQPNDALGVLSENAEKAIEKLKKLREEVKKGIGELGVSAALEKFDTYDFKGLINENVIAETIAAETSAKLWKKAHEERYNDFMNFKNLEKKAETAAVKESVANRLEAQKKALKEQERATERALKEQERAQQHMYDNIIANFWGDALSGQIRDWEDFNDSMVRTFQGTTAELLATWTTGFGDKFNDILNSSVDAIKGLSGNNGASHPDGTSEAAKPSNFDWMKSVQYVGAIYSLADGLLNMTNEDVPPIKVVLDESSVLGAARGTGSQSIANSLANWEDIGADQYSELQGIYDEMKELNYNITGLATGIVRSFGDFSGVPAGVTLGTNDGSVNEAFGNFPSWMMGGTGDDLLGGLLLNTVGDVLDNIFGGTEHVSMQGAGLDIGAATVQSILDGADLTVQKWTQTLTYTEGGWFSDSSDTWNTYYEGVDSSITGLFTKVGQSIGEGLQSLDKYLGTAIDFSQVEIDLGTINLMGLEGSEITEKVNELVSKTYDELTEQLFGSLYRSYQQIGEGFAETMIRLVGENSVIMGMLDKTNSAFDGTTQEAIAFSQALISMSSDFKTLSESFSAYYNNFFTDIEKQADIKNTLTSSLGVSGLALPDNREAYRAAVEAVDLSTEAGMKLYVRLLELAKTADDYYDYLEDAAADADAAMENARANYLTALNAEISVKEQEYRILEDNLSQARENYLAALDTEILKQEDARDAAERAAATYRNLADSLKSSQTDLLISSGILDPAQASSLARGEYEKALQGAWNKDEKALAALPDLAKAYLETSQKTLGKSEYEKLFGDVYRQLGTAEEIAITEAKTQEDIADIAGEQLISLEQQRAELTEATSTLLSIDQAADEYHSAALDLEMSGLSAQISLYQQQLDELRQLNSNILSLADARQAYTDAGGTTLSTSSSDVNSVDYVTDMYNTLLHRAPDNAGLAFWVDAINNESNPVNRDNLADTMLNAASGYADGGISSGPKSGYWELLHGTEAIIPLGKGSLPIIFQGGLSMEPLVAEFRLLREFMEKKEDAEDKRHFEISRDLTGIKNSVLILEKKAS